MKISVAGNGATGVFGDEHRGKPREAATRDKVEGWLCDTWRPTRHRGAAHFASEAAARRFDLDRAAGVSGRPDGGDVGNAGPFVAFLSWDEAERWLRDQPG